MNRTLIAIAAALLWSAAMFGGGWLWRGDRADASGSKQEAKASAAALQQINDTRATEHAQAEAVAAIGAKHEEDRQAAAAVPAAVAAELRAGNLRLRDEWAGCETQRLSDASAATRERDALAASRDDLAGAVVRAGRDADDQVRACQAVVQADRNGSP